MKRARNQHYVPQFILRNFSANKKEQIHVLDKRSERRFLTAIRNVAAERDFYDFDVGDETLTVDPSLQVFEDRISNVIGRVVQTRSLGDLTLEESFLMATFVAIQRLRVPNAREITRHTWLSLNEWLRATGTDPEFIRNLELRTEEELKEHAVRMIVASKGLVPHILDKAWLLLETSNIRPFITSDNPVALHNSAPRGPLRGNIGFAVPGIEIYIPLSSRLTLVLFCKTHEDELRSGVATAPAGHARASVERMLDAIESGRALKVDPDNVDFANSLQVFYAERFLFSASDDFSLPEAMISERPSLRTGPRIEIPKRPSF